MLWTVNNAKALSRAQTSRREPACSTVQTSAVLLLQTLHDKWGSGRGEEAIRRMSCDVS